MNIEDLRNHCIVKPGVTEEFPFDADTLVFKVMGKMFALANVEDFVSVNLKCDPEKAIRLREEFEDVLPGYHMNKKHWNTVMAVGILSDQQIREWVDDSYDLVVSGLPAKLKAELKNL
ncbi:MmcQ/YjbR family DNA-binding protein [Marinoscillum sp. 108]|uniref:MmcQ/YjbR family DNA-binding protein n=1 Tax=Marinoscillum sp. 108 TaxID=2653151 RepID=UPI0012F1696D|nr:MmcQ/YjbR family DNA-binding protein [Marinoscillum sp. 108]VXD12168.1 MmcQ-like protein [Marinoscillum sp. 108]